MSVVTEVSDILKLVGEGIGNIRAIIKAARDGYAYLHQHHKQAEQDLAALLEELSKLTVVLADAASIVTGFAFTVSGSALDKQPDRFNDLLVQRQEVLARFEAQRNYSLTSCGKIYQHAQVLDKEATGKGVRNLFGLLDAADEQAKKLSDILYEVYANDSVLIQQFDDLGKAVRLALDDVQSVLGPSGAMRPENVPAAAERLGEYRRKFNAMQREADEVNREMRSLVYDLRFPPVTPAPAGA